MKDRVLIFNGYYFPSQKYGGPTTSVENMVEACSDVIDFYVIVVNHDFGETEKFSTIHDGWNEHGSAKVLYVNDNDFTLKNIQNWIEDIKPVSIYLGGVLSIRNFRYLIAANKRKVKVVVPPRGEVCDNAVKRKSYKKTPFFALLKMFGVYKKCYFHATSQAEYDGVIKYLGVKKDNIKLLPNIPKKILYGHESSKNAGELNAVYIARICNTKNLLEALRALKNVKGTVHYSIYGPMEDPQYWKECEAQIKELPSNVTVEYLGSLNPNDVSTVYFNSNCTILPTITENYGHSIVESLVAGCPCVLPKGTTPWDSINEVAGFTYSLGNIEQLTSIVQKLVDMDEKDYSMFIESTYEYAKNQIASESLINEYVEMLIR